MLERQKITPCLWYNSQAHDAAAFYTGIFPGSRINRIAHYGEAGREIHGMPPGSVLTVEFELEGQTFVALNGGAEFRFNEAISLQVHCDTQDEVDHFWARLSEGGDPQAQMCGWLKDRYGVSWQIVPSMLPDMIVDPDKEKSGRVMTALMQMKKLDIEALRRAYVGKS